MSKNKDPFVYQQPPHGLFGHPDSRELPSPGRIGVVFCLVLIGHVIVVLLGSAACALVLADILDVSASLWFELASLIGGVCAVPVSVFVTTGILVREKDDDARAN